jgi:hypothetical protein
VTLKGQSSKANSAKRELAKVPTAPAAALASVVNSRGEQVEIQPRGLRPLHCFLVRLALLLLDSTLRIVERSLELVRLKR